ncbi:hypothetical protein LV780_20285 (plasmid) [Cereibacter azotoformans]|uniref:hypothetical protein n=1 Tax=Cereibacter azotoformans TaxID=43057 RepID=UPI000E35B89F|nr:hypothetical protein [Cereibacter azotoformans]AXQ96079.1 hypothetical protein D0Z66_20345 [Cereibacter sphaeroides]UIJ33132.1 hypothetical protein LV780_20285 [Cereibacter azotoformans]
MQLVLDTDSFERPFLAAFDETVGALENAGRIVSGAAARAEMAKRDLDDLKTFKAEVVRHLRAGTLASLPALRAAYRRIRHCHHLTVGPWTGVFLMDPDGVLAIGLVFSKAPHSFLDRLHELVNVRLAVLDQALARGIGDDEAGRTRPLADVIARLERKYEVTGRSTD